MTDAPPTGTLEPTKAATGAAPGPGRGGLSKRRPVRPRRAYGILIVWIAVISLVSIKRPSTFPTTVTFETIFSTQAVLLVMTLGLIVALTADEFDLSIGAAMGFGAVLVGG